MERSGTLAEPSDNSTTPYIKKRPTLLGQPHQCYNNTDGLFAVCRIFLVTCHVIGAFVTETVVSVLEVLSHTGLYLL